MKTNIIFDNNKIMQEAVTKSKVNDLEELGIKSVGNIFWNLSPAELTEHIIKRNEGTLSNTGAIACSTGHFTGRSPDDRFFVIDDLTRNTINWGDINHPIEEKYFDLLFQKMMAFTEGKDLYARDAFACADPEYSINLRVITSYAFHSLFCHNMFLRPDVSDLQQMKPEYTIICFPEFVADPSADGVKSKNFAIINLSKKIILIGGTAYTGEIKKGIFSVLNYILPHNKKVLSMHASTNVGKKGDTAIFFGLSGTGKTTLSADPERYLIGDDEHGWDDKGVFNFEGGCYAKVINLDKEQEPQIYSAIKFGAVLENTRFYPGTRNVNFTDDEVTPNTRVSYPVEYIPNAVHPSIGSVPSNIFFLTTDAFGVLPPIAKLTPGQAQFYFISGYTAKVAGTEEGIVQPKPVFSACFGEPFMPLPPFEYAILLGKKMKKHKVNVWLINTGWTGGPYGVGTRIELKYTRAMISSILNGEMEQVNYFADPIFKMLIPEKCGLVPQELLKPENTWKNKTEFKLTANKLAKAFVDNFSKYKSINDSEILEGMPKTNTVSSINS